MSRSIHDNLGRVRPPRVHIRYDVHIGDAVVQKELPFVVGVMGDFSGDPTAPLKPLKQRNFTPIDRDNFNDVMAKMTPGLNLKVENTLEGGKDELSVNLKFSSMEDFEPAAVVRQVEPLRKLLETRNRLKDLLLQAGKSDKLEGLLEEILQDPEQLKKLEEGRAAKPGDAAK